MHEVIRANAESRSQFLFHVKRWRSNGFHFTVSRETRSQYKIRNPSGSHDSAETPTGTPATRPIFWKYPIPVPRKLPAQSTGIVDSPMGAPPARPTRTRAPPAAFRPHSTDRH